MYDIAIWKVAVDALLLLALLCLGYRLSRSEGPAAKLPRLLEIEASLKRIIGEADQVGSSLNRQLQGRQRDLEKLLYDLETIEQRVTRTMNAADERKQTLEHEVGKARQIFEELSSVNVSAGRLADPRRERPQPAPEPTVELETIHRPEPVEEPTPASFKTRAAPAESSPMLNVYGEPVTRRPAAPPPPPAAPQGLRGRMEKTTVQNPYVRPSAAKARMEDIYFAAEEMLRAGKEVQFVAGRTRLPLDEVKMLAQMLERQRAVEQDLEKPAVHSDDPRLGVLSPVNRQAETI